MKRSRFFVMCVMALVVLTTPTLFSQEEGTPAPEIATVIGVHDGDTITVEFPPSPEFPYGMIETVRLVGVDAPELKSSYCPYTQPYARKAQIFAAALMDGKRVRLERDVRNRDRFQRLLRHVYVLHDDGTELYANEAMVIAGFAKADPWYPDLRNAERFRVLERTAREEHRERWHSRKKKVALRSIRSELFYCKERPFLLRFLSNRIPSFCNSLLLPLTIRGSERGLYAIL